MQFNWFGNNGGFIDAGSFTMRGFSADKSQNAIAVITEYIASIDAQITKMTATVDSIIDSALKGTEQQTKVCSYIEATILELKNVSNYFTAFNEGLKTAATNYNAKQSGINVSEVTDSKTATGYTSDEDVSGVTPFNG
jgi:hypothetical protein